MSDQRYTQYKNRVFKKLDTFHNRTIQYLSYICIIEKLTIEERWRIITSLH